MSWNDTASTTTTCLKNNEYIYLKTTFNTFNKSEKNDKKEKKVEIQYFDPEELNL
jgi:hypothetical protein